MAKKSKSSAAQILPFGKALVYSLGILGIQTFIGLVNSYQSQFYTSIFKADLMKCAVIILVGKIISSLSDQVIGKIIDNSHFKSGKMKPFVAISILPLALLTTVMFIGINFKSDFAMYAYITVTTILWNISMTFADIPSQGMLAVITPDPKEKSVAAGISNTLRSFGLVVANGVIPITCMLTGSAMITKKEYLIAALIIDAMGLILVGVMLAGTKEIVRSQPQNMTFKSLIEELKTNKELQMIFWMNMLGFGRNIGMNIGVQCAAVLFDEVNLSIGSLQIHLAGENLPIILGVGCGITSTISVLLSPVITQKIGPKKTYLWLEAYGTIVSILAFVLFVFSGAGGFFRSVWGIIILQFLIGLMFGPHNYVPLVMLNDTVDYHEMMTGKRTEGVQFSVLSLAIKLSNALSVAVGIFLVGASGYIGTMTFAEITPKIQNIVICDYWLIPGICAGLSCIPLFFYKLDNPEIKAKIKAFKASHSDMAVDDANASETDSSDTAG